MIRTICTWIAIILVIGYVAKHGSQVGGTLREWANGAGDFMTALLG